MFLLKQLQALKLEAERTASREELAAYRRSLENLLRSGLLEKAIKVGDRMPDFALRNSRNELIRSADLLSSGLLVISFYRGKWCPFCNLELAALNRFLPEFRKHSATLVAISPQLPAFNLEMIDKNGLQYDVLSDTGNELAQALGLAYSLDEDLRAVYSKGGTDLSAYNGDGSWMLPMPARLIVDQDSQVRYVRINPDHTNRPEPEETLAALAEIAASA